MASRYASGAAAPPLRGSADGCAEPSAAAATESRAVLFCTTTAAHHQLISAEVQPATMRSCWWRPVHVPQCDTVSALRPHAAAGARGPHWCPLRHGD